MILLYFLTSGSHLINFMPFSSHSEAREELFREVTKAGARSVEDLGRQRGWHDVRWVSTVGGELHGKNGGSGCMVIIDDIMMIMKIYEDYQHQL